MLILVGRAGGEGRSGVLPQTVPLRHLTTADGLRSSVVQDVVQDQQGFFWIATRQGLDRYREDALLAHFDAENTTLFPDARLTTMIQDARGQLWFGTYGGLVLYIEAGFTTLTRRHGLPDDRLLCLLATPGDRLWLGTWKGLGRHGENAFDPLPASTGLPRTAVAALLAEPSGDLWVGFAADGLWRYDGQTFVPVDQGLGAPRLKVHLLREDRQGDLWIGTAGNGLWRYRRPDQRLSPEPLPAATILCLQEDPQGRLWAGTADGLFQRSESTWKPVPLATGTEPPVTALLADQEQSLWIGTWGRGLWQRREGTLVPVEALADRQIYALLEDRRQQLWAATDQGLYRRRDRTWQPFPVPASPPVGPVRALLEDDQGRLWAGTADQGLLRIAGDHPTLFHPDHRLPAAAINAQRVTADGVLWLATGGGLVRYDGEQFLPYGPASGLPHLQVYALAPAGPQALWLGTARGLARYQDGRITLVLPDSLLPAPAVLALAAAPDGVLWLATGGGLVRYDGRQARVFTTADGLPHDHLRGLALDRRGRLWIATSGGLGLLENGRFTRYTTADGLTTNLLYALCVDRDNGLWIGTLGGGAMRYDGRRFLRLTTQEGLLSNTVRSLFQDRDGHLWLATDKGLSQYHRDNIPPMPRTFSLRYAALGLLLLLVALAARWFLRRRRLPLVSLLALAGFSLTPPALLDAASAPQIADLRAVQRPGTRWIDIAYTLEGPPGQPLIVVAEASDDAGQTFQVPVLSLLGDVGQVVPGPGRSLVWDAGADAPYLFATPWQVRLRVFSSPPTGDQVRIPAGPFTMGSREGDPQEKPVHQVYLQTYWLDRYETTNRAFMYFIQATGYHTLAESEGESTIYEDGGYRTVYGATWKAPKGPGTDLRQRLDHPVVQIAWPDAWAYCAWAGQRLPTEAEWEKAARGPDQRLYPWGDDPPDGGGLLYRANYGTDQCCRESAQDGYLNTAPVGSFPRGVSPYGLHDMAGNVWEWTQDWYGATYYASSPARDPAGPPAGAERVLRGGSWISYRFMLRTAYRGHHTEETRHNYSGFRCARD